MAHPGGRPTLYNKELTNKICEQIADGKSIRTICKAEDMPGMSTIFTWLGENQEFQEQYTRAKSMQSDAFIEDMLDKTENVSTDKDSIAKARLQVDTMKWIASKLKPKVYGDKVDVTSKDEKIQVIPLLDIQRLKDEE